MNQKALDELEKGRSGITFWGEPILNKTESKRQHFVPRLHLKNFATADGKIRVFDLQESREYLASLTNVAVERHFYNINIEGVDLSSEDWLAKLESDASSVVQTLIEDPSAITKLTGKQENSLSRFVAALSVRTPSLRQAMNHVFEDVLSQVEEKIQAQFLNQLGERQEFAEFEEWRSRPVHERLGEEKPTQSAAVTNFLLGEVQGFANLVRAAPWRVGKALGRLRLYTSDNPVAHYAGPLSPWWNGMGFASFHYYIALSPDLLLKVERRPDRGNSGSAVNPRGERRNKDFSEWEISIARHSISRDSSRFFYGSGSVVSKQCAESCLDRIEHDMREFAIKYHGYSWQTFLDPLPPR